MITFKGEQIRCDDNHTFLDIQGGDLHVQRSYFWGLSGTSEIVGSPSFWLVSSVCWLVHTDWVNSAAGYAKLKTYLRNLRKKIGDHGQLESKFSNGVVENKWKGATFEGFVPSPFDGHQAPSPIIDSVGMVSSVNGFIFQGTLQWTVLVDEE